MKMLVPFKVTFQTWFSVFGRGPSQPSPGRLASPCGGSGQGHDQETREHATRWDSDADTGLKADARIRDEKQLASCPFWGFPAGDPQSRALCGLEAVSLR